jgi:hypothetical protein
MPQLAAEVASKTSKVETLLRIDSEKSATSQFFIIKAKSPVKGIVSPTIELEPKFSSQGSTNALLPTTW